MPVPHRKSHRFRYSLAPVEETIIASEATTGKFSAEIT